MPSNTVPPGRLTPAQIQGVIDMWEVNGNHNLALRAMRQMQADVKEEKARVKFLEDAIEKAESDLDSIILENSLDG